MDGWESARLGDVCYIDKKKHNGGSLPFLGMEHIESGSGQLASEPTLGKVKSSTFYFNETYLLYGRLRPYLNKVFLPDFQGHCSTEIFPIKCSSKLNRRFLFYWLITETTVAAIDSTSTGTRMPRANVNALLNFNFPLPPLSKQKQIVAILDKVFAGIETATANTKKNLANARELFESQLNQTFQNIEFAIVRVLVRWISGGLFLLYNALNPLKRPSKFLASNSKNQVNFQSCLRKKTSSMVIGAMNRLLFPSTLH